MSEYITLLITFVRNASFDPSLSQWALKLRRDSVPEHLFVYPNSEQSHRAIYDILDLDARMLGQIANVEQIAGSQVEE